MTTTSNLASRALVTRYATVLGSALVTVTAALFAVMLWLSRDVYARVQDLETERTPIAVRLAQLEDAVRRMGGELDRVRILLDERLPRRLLDTTLGDKIP